MQKEKNKMKVGFIQAYNESSWIGYAVDQAMILCDKLLIVEGSQFAAFPDIPIRSNDGTLDIISDKTRQYPRRIKTIPTIRKHNNYRLNQCDNFNHVLNRCKIGDYFIHLDADEFFSDECIKSMNEIMDKNKIDIISPLSSKFAFGFKWLIDFGKLQPRRLAVKKTEGLYFRPTHHYVNPGKSTITFLQGSHYHYCWLKPRERMRLRMRTSGMYPNMLKWFDENWDNFELENGKEYSGYVGKFILHRYEGNHPSVLDNHHWRDVEDMRRL